MKHKHTPGPWSVRFDFVVQATSFDGGRLVPVAQPYGVNSDGTDLFANARLIAASPDLLTTLIALREYLSKCPPHAGDTTGAEWGRVMDQSGAAIIKATGGRS